MKVLRLAGLGVVIWGLSLLWPGVNQLLTPPLMIGLILGLGASALAYGLIQRLDYHHNDNSAGQDHSSCPVPLAVSR
jgi:hypothetical protein